MCASGQACTSHTPAVHYEALGATLKAVNDELARRGYVARMARAGGYFYFHLGEAAEWLDRTVPGERISERSVAEWVAEFERLRALNESLLKPAGAAAAKQRRTRKA